MGLYVILLGHFVAYSQPFNLVYRQLNPSLNKGAMDSSFFFGDASHFVKRHEVGMCSNAISFDLVHY
jgi:hypothetical protein